MKKYGNASGDSGVLAYQYGKDWIKVLFRDHPPYTYSYKLAGKKHVEKMKMLADRGKGLSTYISQHVKDQYDP
jgi:hypothetical protein